MGGLCTSVKSWLMTCEWGTRTVSGGMRRTFFNTWLDRVFQGQYMYSLCHCQQRFGEITTTDVLDEDENLS